MNIQIPKCLKIYIIIKKKNKNRNMHNDIKAPENNIAS